MSIELENLEEFEKLYNDAIKSESRYFLYDGRLVLTAYARYIIEYLTSKKENNGSKQS